MPNKNIELYDLGRASYQPVWDLQHAVQQRLIDEKRAEQKGNFEGTRLDDFLLFVEHPHVYTLGKSGKEEHMLRTMMELQQLEAEFIKIDRGGDITYHGPGQIVGYPILDLDRHFTDVHKYLRFLEEVMIRVCADYGFEAGRIEGATGVWVDNAKICAMGIRCSRWVTMHGFALNVNTDLRYFNNIVPCGIDDKAVISLQKLSGKEIDTEEVKERIIHHFEDVFEVSISHKGSLQEVEQIIS
ncbi:lipoyl(octanoyl) transferase LipB [Gracilimonas mengyeensis]|uniref:Octanoyltransferase n=1 Tax=Gracilimonas mengyeensis TaxID=1302730 RepID=A0A521DEL6_9BACT|nr:lipoyl(octanoyl) transferase LipB [Gracilimonas mengyeensis]SMO69581.1 lipoyl(octanoyl) transferase [Gracilimonas mengyeensis]